MFPAFGNAPWFPRRVHQSIISAIDVLTWSSTYAHLPMLIDEFGSQLVSLPRDAHAYFLYLELGIGAHRGCPSTHACLLPLIATDTWRPGASSVQRMRTGFLTTLQLSCTPAPRPLRQRVRSDPGWGTSLLFTPGVSPKKDCSAHS